jgi:acyl-CoA thioesterase I
MKAKWIFALLATLLSLSMVGCDRTPRLDPLPEDAVILAFGDSLTYGTSAGEGEDYPSVLARLTGYRVVNAGVPGEVTAQGVERLPDVLAEVQPDLVILMHGGNDILQRRSATELEANIRKMIDLSRQAGAQVFLLGVPQPTHVVQSIPLFENVSWDMMVPFDKHALPDVLRNKSFRSEDGHLNAEGYAALAATLAKRLPAGNRR